MEHAWLVISNIAVAYAAIVTTSLVVVYALFSTFERSQVGRQFMLTKASLAIVLDYWAAIIFFVRPPTEYASTLPIRTIICVGIGTIMLRWLLILVHVQRDARRKKHPVWDAPEEPPSVRRES